MARLRNIFNFQAIKCRFESKKSKMQIIVGLFKQFKSDALSYCQIFITLKIFDYALWVRRFDVYPICWLHFFAFSPIDFAGTGF
jgi:hypothetical protein